MKMKKWMGAVLAIVMLGLVSGCGSDNAKPAAGKAPVSKELVVGTAPGFAPFEFTDDKTKEYVGFDIEIAQALSKKMGYEKCKIAAMGFDALIPALEAKNIDVIIAGMTITDERAKKVNFTKSYYKNGLVVVVNKANTTVKDVKDLEGKTVCSQIGTTGALYAAKIKDAKAKDFNTFPDAFLELKNGGVDAVIADLSVAQWYLKNGGEGEAKIVGDILVGENLGMATNKENKELVEKLDKAMDELHKDGTYDKIYSKWFGAAPAK